MTSRGIGMKFGEGEGSKEMALQSALRGRLPNRWGVRAPAQFIRPSNPSAAKLVPSAAEPREISFVY